MTAGAPHVPPILSADLPPAGGAVGPDPEAFVVDEIPLYDPSGSGPHVYVRVRKRGRTTMDVVRDLARAASVHPRDVGHAGLKDKQAVTTQWLSFPGSAKSPGSWELPDGVEILETSRHGNKLRVGHQAGNRFSIRLDGVVPDAARRAADIVALLRERGLPNYFGAQRFGRAGAGLRQALAWLRSGGRSRGPRARFRRSFYPSVIQSEVFNRYLTLRLERGLDALLEGEVVRLDGSGSLFAVGDPAAEHDRLKRGDLHPTGPILGPKMLAASADAAALEARAALDAGIGDDDRAALARLAPGSRRDLLVRPRDLAIAADGGSLTLRFDLPSGSYATQLLRELTRGPWHAGGREAS